MASSPFEMGTIGLRRLKSELKNFKKDPEPGVEITEIEEDFSHMDIDLSGQPGTPYSGGVFSIHLTFPDTYPFHPPQAKFVTPIFHPNIDDSGRICLSIFSKPPSGDWRPSLSLRNVFQSLWVLMACPNPSHPLMPDIAEMYQFRKEEYDMKAAEWTKKYAMKK